MSEELPLLEDADDDPSPSQRHYAIYLVVMTAVVLAVIWLYYWAVNPPTQ